MNHELLQTIDSIDDIIIESEINVINALMESYNKALLILENYDGDDLSSFSIFQEVNILDTVKEMGKNDTVIVKIIKFIPRLIKSFYQCLSKKLSKDKIDAVQNDAKEIETIQKELNDFPEVKESLDKMISSAGNGQLDTKEILKALEEIKIKKKTGKKIGRQLYKKTKYIEKGFNNSKKLDNLKSWLIKNGLKAGGAAIVIGGSAYVLDKNKELIKEKASEYKGKVIKKFDETVLDPIREAGNETVDKITNIADSTVEKISKIASKIEEAVRKTIENIKKLFNTIQNFFKVKFLGYTETSEQGIVCKYNLSKDEFVITMNLDIWDTYLKEVEVFISKAVKFIGRTSYENGNWQKSDDSKRSGPIMDFEKDKRKAIKDADNAKGIDKFKAVVDKNIKPSGEEIVQLFKTNMEKIAKNAEHKAVYNPITNFTEHAKNLRETLTQLQTKTNSLSDIYEKMLNGHEYKSKGIYSADMEIHKTVSGIIQTLIHLTNGIDGAMEYINNLNDIISSQAIEE